MFATHGGDGLSRQASADLALEIVLNEIVEQACLATGATGAAIALLRDDEMVCRASSGTNAPELGARLDGDSGLTAECLKTRQIQRCDDAQADPRVDMEASRSLGVRSLMIVPLLQKGDPLGVLEVFSSRPGVFGERDASTLQALAQRILRNLQQARMSVAAAKNDSVKDPAFPFSRPEANNFGAGLGSASEEKYISHPLDMERRARPRFDVVTLALGGAIIVCALLVGTFLGIGMGWRRSLAVRASVTKPDPVSAQKESVQDARADASEQKTDATSGRQAPSANAGTVPTQGDNSTTVVEEKKSALPIPVPVKTRSVPPPQAGGLRVYENGKEIFYLPPTNGGGTRATATNAITRKNSTQSTPILEPAKIIELSPQSAEGNLLRRVEPDYPEEARAQGIQGPVVLDVRIGQDGSTQEVKVASGNPLLAEAAMAAVKQWRFKPHLVDGRPVQMQTRITLNFKLPG